jgi:hypothetical protein
MKLNCTRLVHSALFLVSIGLSACSGGGGGSAAPGNGSSSYTVGGSVSGLTAGSLVLQDNGGDNLTVSGNATFAFAIPLGSGSAYNVTVFTQPTGQTCAVSNGSGTLLANVTNVTVACSAVPAGGDQYGSGPDPAPAPTGNPTSDELIDAAQTAGTITAEDALIYKVFSDFGDTRLPAQYRGDNIGFIEGDAQHQVVAYIDKVGINNVSAATLDTLRPFFVPAYYEGSWWNQKNPTATKAIAAPGAVTSAPSNPNCRVWDSLNGGSCSLLAEWKSVAGVNVVVWYLAANETSDAPKAAMLVQEYDSTIWPKLTTLMDRKPISDLGTGLVAETDPRYDILLIDMEDNKEGVTIPNTLNSCKMSSSHIYLSRNLPNRGLIAQAAHEFMHALQFSMPLAGSCVNTYYTTLEATAVWATNYVYPKNDWEHRYAKHYLAGGWVNESYDYHPPKPSLFRYGAYVLPLFLETRYGPSIVKGIWDQAAVYNQELFAIDSAIGAATLQASSFQKEWPKFAAANWNRDALSKTYWDKDILVDNVDQLDGDDTFALSAGGTGNLRHPVSVKHAAAKYYRVVFSDAAVRSVVIVNGLNFKADTLNLPGWGSNLTFTGLDALARQGASLQVFLKVNGAWLNGSTDLSNVPWYSVCRDDPAGKIDEMIIIYANAEISPSAPNYAALEARSENPGIFATNIGCRDWTGGLTMTRSLPAGQEKLTVTGVTLKNALPTQAPQPGSGAPNYPVAAGSKLMLSPGWVYAFTAGSASWSYSSYSGGCNRTGAKTFDISDATRAIVSNSAFTPPGAADHGIFIPGFTNNALQTVVSKLSYDWICVATDGTVTSGNTVVGTQLDFSVIMNDPKVRISTTGLSVSGTGAQSGDPTNVTGTWSLQGNIN